MKYLLIAIILLASCTPFTIRTERGTLRVERLVPVAPIKPQVAPGAGRFR